MFHGQLVYFCKYPETCDCYGPSEHCFNKQVPDNTNGFEVQNHVMQLGASYWVNGVSFYTMDTGIHMVIDIAFR